MWLLSVVPLILLARNVLAAKCPSEELVAPCQCSTLQDSRGEDFSTLTCSNLLSEEDLENALVATIGYPMFELELVNSALRFFPHDAFKGTSYEVVSIRNTSLTSLSDSERAFEGLEKQMHLLEVVNCSYTAGWDWTQLASLQHLLEVHLVDSELLDITNGLASVQHIDVEAFVFQRNNIQVLDDDVFAPFTNLQRLLLDNNEIKEVKRSMFPRPATFLKILGFSYNKIVDLPIDMFTEMPKLKSLYLTGNPLTTINEEVFRPIWNQLHLLLFYATQLSCDCRITWLARADNRNKYMHAECAHPPLFQGRFLHDLLPNELHC